MIEETVRSLAIRMHRNFLKRNQNTSFKSDYVEFLQAARVFLGLKNESC